MQSVIRIILLLFLVGGFFYVWNYQPKFVQALFANKSVSNLLDTADTKAREIGASLNIDLDNVLGAATDKVSEASPASQLQSLTTEITDKIKDIPKNQAREIVTNICNQIISNIDK